MKDVGHCNMVIFAFIFQFRALLAAHVGDGNITVTAPDVTGNLTCGKEQRAYRLPLHFRYRCNLTWPASTSPIDWLLKWCAVRLSSPEFFKLVAGSRLGTAHLGAAVSRALHLTATEAPLGHYYGSHSARIGGFDELLGLGFGSAWIVNRLHWVAAGMLKVYYESRLSVTAV